MEYQKQELMFVHRLRDHIQAIIGGNSNSQERRTTVASRGGVWSSLELSACRILWIKCTKQNILVIDDVACICPLYRQWNLVRSYLFLPCPGFKNSWPVCWTLSLIHNTQRTHLWSLQLQLWANEVVEVEIATTIIPMVDLAAKVQIQTSIKP